MSRAAVVDVVLKLGGSLLRDAEALEALAARLGALAGRSLLVVPGGGPFADAVREAQGRLGFGSDAAHWMAVLAMDQHAHLLQERVPGAVIVEWPDDVRGAIALGRLPVLAPYRWLRRADPLPHSWAATSDSIAAWVAGALGARRLVLAKPPGAEAAPSVFHLVDTHFRSALPRGVEVVAAVGTAAVARAIEEGTSASGQCAPFAAAPGPRSSGSSSCPDHSVHEPS